MLALLGFLLFSLPFKSKSRLEAENAVLRRQLVVLQRSFIQLYRWFPSVLKAITVIRPETLVRWHRAGFSRYWHWKSRSLGGRPQIEADLRALIRRMSIENPLWGAPRIHGELLKLGFEVAQSSVAKCMVKQHGSLSTAPHSRSRLDSKTADPECGGDRSEPWSRLRARAPSCSVVRCAISKVFGAISGRSGGFALPKAVNQPRKLLAA
jgi:hypothetical protein